MLDSVGSILNSASKIVLIMLALTVCITYGLGILSEDTFKGVVMAVFIYYFTYKPQDVKQQNNSFPTEAVK